MFGNPVVSRAAKVVPWCVMRVDANKVRAATAQMLVQRMKGRAERDIIDGNRQQAAAAARRLA